MQPSLGNNYICKMHLETTPNLAAFVTFPHLILLPTSCVSVIRFCHSTTNYLQGAYWPRVCTSSASSLMKEKCSAYNMDACNKWYRYCDHFHDCVCSSLLFFSISSPLNVDAWICLVIVLSCDLEFQSQLIVLVAVIIGRNIVYNIVYCI